jgi:hypothetical protein
MKLTARREAELRLAARESSPATAPWAGGSGVAGLLCLQRTAGNRAVLRRLGRDVLARKGDPLLGGRLLGQLSEAERKGLQEITGVSALQVPADKKVQNVALKPEFLAGTPAGFQAPLTNVLDELLRSWLSNPNTTAAVELDLADHGGGKTVWRFTHLETPKATRYLIDLVTNQAVAPAGPAGAAKFKAHGFSISASDPAFAPVVQQAVERIPDAFLSQIDGVTFKRGAADAKDPTRVGGRYDPATHTVTIFDLGMKTSASRYDDDAGYATPLDERVREVAHELGHAIDDVALARGFSDQAAAKKELQDSWSGNVTFDADGGLQWKDDGLSGDDRKRFRTVLDRFEKAGKRLDKVKSDTGHGIVGSTPALNTDFKKALDADGSRPLTPYVGEKRAAWQAEKDVTKKLDLEAEFVQEAYAEAFSLYTTEPETLRALRPKIFAFFKDKQGKLEKAAAAKKP